MNGFRSPFANITPVVKNIIIINIICFLPCIVFSDAVYNNLVVNNFAAFYFNSPNFKVWQIITYMFLHGGFMHIFFNMFVLFSFGPIVEYSIGPKRFLNFYFICGIGAVALQLLVQAIEVHSITGAFTIPHPSLESSYLQYGAQAQKLFDIYNAPMVGASGAIFGIMIAFGMMFPNLEMMIIFLPIPIKAKYLIPGYIVLELYLGLNQSSGDSVAHFAHLGGALIGFIMVKAWRLQRPNNFY